MKIPKKRWEVWTMRDGTEISVGEMEESHLRNTLNLLLKQRRERIEASFKKEVGRYVKEAFPEEYWRD